MGNVWQLKYSKRLECQDMKKYILLDPPTHTIIKIYVSETLLFLLHVLHIILFYILLFSFILGPKDQDGSFPREKLHHFSLKSSFQYYVQNQKGVAMSLK